MTSQTQQRTDDRELVEPIVDLRQLATYVPQRSSPTTRPLAAKAKLLGPTPTTRSDRP